MVTVCPLLAVTVAVAMVTRVCLVGNDAMMLVCRVLEPAGRLLPPEGALNSSAESMKRRRRCPPLGGELYRSSRVVGEGDEPRGM